MNNKEASDQPEASLFYLQGTSYRVPVAGHYIQGAGQIVSRLKIQGLETGNREPEPYFICN